MVRELEEKAKVVERAVGVGFGGCFNGGVVGRSGDE